MSLRACENLRRIPTVVAEQILLYLVLKHRRDTEFTAVSLQLSALSWMYLQQWLRGPVMDRSEPRAKQAGMMNTIVSHPRSLTVAALNTC